MAPEKERISVMILYVDLKCPSCYKKVSKLLSKFPQIRDRVFDVDKNKVTIRAVVCCDPERLRDKLCCKGGRTIQGIEIVKNKPPPLKQPTPAPAPKPVVAPQPEPVKMPDPVPQPQPQPQPQPVKMQHTTPMPMLMPMPMDGYHLHQPLYQPVSGWCQECYGYGRHVLPPPSYDYYGYQYPSNRPYYFSDDPQGCSIM